jgi:Fe-S-cluster containining protein
MRRQERRLKLKQSVDLVSRGGMDLTASGGEQSWSVIGATRILLDILEGRSPSRAGIAARRAHEFFEISLKRNPSKYPIACAKGCAFCCHVSVTATAPEIFLVANTLREQHRGDFDALLTRVRAADERTRGMTSMERAQQKIPCALLEQNMCSVYEARPGACRGFTSTKVKACEAGFNGEDAQIDTPAVWTSLRSAHKQALWAALAAAKLSATLYEFHHGLRIALEQSDAELRWLKGEDVFAAVAREYLGDPAANAHNQKIIDTLVAGALGKEFPSN